MQSVLTKYALISITWVVIAMLLGMAKIFNSGEACKHLTGIWNNFSYLRKVTVILYSV